MKNKEIMEIHNRRYACKNYDKSKKVSDEDFITIIESGRLAPVLTDWNHGNFYYWKMKK